MKKNNKKHIFVPLKSNFICVICKCLLDVKKQRKECLLLYTFLCLTAMNGQEHLIYNVNIQPPALHR